MRIYLLCDYDVVLKASCNGKKLSRKADEMNGIDYNKEVLHGLYSILDIELEDIPKCACGKELGKNYLMGVEEENNA